MTSKQRRCLGFISIALVSGATLAACGGLDPRKVTRGPRDDGGGASGGEDSGPAPGAGGADSAAGGGDSNPFGGDKGYEGGAPPVVDGPPTVVQVSPEDGADAAEPNDDVGLRFSEGLDPDTVTLDNVKVMDGETEIEGELSYEGIDALFEPARRLSLLATYDVTVSTDVTDAGGIALEEPFTSRFTVRDGKWASAAPAFDDDALSFDYHQRAAIDGRGNALVIWTKQASETDQAPHVWARWYRLSGGWQEPVQLDESATSVDFPALALSPEGDAVVAWFESDGVSGYRTYARRYVGGDWETAPVQVDATLGVTFQYMRERPAVAIGAGRVVVSWLQRYDSGSVSYDYHVAAGAAVDGEWSTQIGAGNYGAVGQYLSNVSATMTAEGTALSTVNHYGTPVSGDATYGPGINFLRATAGGTWTSGRITGSLPGSAVTVASASDGAVAMWIDYDTTTQKYQLLASRYTRAKGFAAATPIQDPELTQYIDVAESGALASNRESIWAGWSQSVGSSRNAYVSRFDVATGKWDALPTLVSSGEASAYQVKVGVDPHGNAIVAFSEEGPEYTAILSWARYSTAAEGWSAAEPLLSDDTSNEPTSLAVAENGVVALLYRRSLGRENWVGGLFSYFK